MSNTNNMFFLKGNVGTKPVLRKTENSKVVNISVAENRVNKDGEVKTYWHQLVAWGPIAESFDNKIESGALVRFVGKNNPKVTEKDGTKNYTNEMLVTSFEELKQYKKDKPTNDENAE